jgi:deoxyribodipyrimidine photo-lyase
MARTLVWFRGKDLRVEDHAPLTAAASAGEVVPVFVLDPYFFAPERARRLPHRIEFLLASLSALEAEIRRLGSKLLVVPGKSIEVVPRLARTLRVDRVVAHRWTEPFGRERDRRVAQALEVPFELFEGETLAQPGTLRTGSGTPFAVYSPFARAFEKGVVVQRALPAPGRLPALPADAAALDRADSVAVPRPEDLGITPNPRILRGGEAAARERLQRFLRGGQTSIAARYVEGRDQLAVDGTSRLSADLKFGTLSVRAAWHAVRDADLPAKPKERFLAELLWREFAYHVLWDRPEVLSQPFRADFRGFPWREDAAAMATLEAWKQGRTGYPVVDAAARQLLAEGYVHNRARMIAASFLAKHLGLAWWHGEAHYLEWLTDGDWAANNLGWQWAAGCGCDAQPYFRIFNPTSQGERHDPDGAYVRRWVPELAKLPAKWIHRPWEASPIELLSAGVRLGDGEGAYPRPVVDHAQARARFLETAKRHFGRDVHAQER